MNFAGSRINVRRISIAAALFLAIALTCQLSHAAFHEWNIREIYTNASGDLQFIELFAPSSSQQFVTNQQIQVSNVGNTQSHTFTITSEPSEDSFNRALLFATAGVQAAGGPTPDYILPNNFLFQTGGSILFFGANSDSYSALPIDGNLSRVWGGNTNAVNSPQNYAGDVGHIVVVPEPQAAALIASGVACIFFSLRRRIANTQI
jgi:hypothetical protein